MRMGLLRELTSDSNQVTDTDASFLRDLISAMVTADGAVDLAEHVTVEALFETVPQLRAAPADARPPVAGRKALLSRLSTISTDKLRRQLFVIAVDLALASDGANEKEDEFLETLRTTLRIDEAFARQTITVVATKYACAR